MKPLPEIRDIRVSWNLGVHNDPELQILLTRIAESEEFRYRERSGCYFAHVGCEVRFKYHSGEPEQQEGYAGRHFDLKMMNGTRKVLKGPWSSRAGVMNARFNPKCMDAHITADGQVWKDGYTFYAGSVTLASVRKWMKDHHDLEWELRKVLKDGEEYYYPAMKGIEHPCPECKGFKEYVPRYSGGKEKVECRWCKGRGQTVPHSSYFLENDGGQSQALRGTV